MDLLGCLHYISLSLSLFKSVVAGGPVKLIKQVKLAHSFLPSVSDQFHFIILSILM